MTHAAESLQIDHDSIAETVVTAVAAAEGVEPAALTPRLYDVIDPDALDALFATAHDSVTVSFPYGDWDVNIADGVVSVTPSSQSAHATEEHGTVA